MSERHVVVGAGPAGLTAAWQLVRAGRPVVVLEQDPDLVGGLARTLEHRGHRYDLGPHRFYTKSAQIARIWQEMLPNGFVEVQRLTRIRYDQSYFPYPLELKATLQGIGLRRASRAALSWLAARVRPRRPEESFEDWVINRFGRELYTTFFKTYTEKVWGVPCAAINRDWAAQRIHGLSLAEVVRHALLSRGARRPKSLIDRFLYPRLGAGALWEAVRDHVLGRGGEVAMNACVARLEHDRGTMRAAVTTDGRRIEGSHFYLTLTLSAFVQALDPPPPEHVLEAGRALRHRDFLSVALIIPRAQLFPDQWIYVHDPGVRVARITNYANWSEAMAPDPRTTAISMEYFCDRQDAVWQARDEQVLAHAARELGTLGLAGTTLPVEGRVHRILDAYPVYDASYQQNREVLRRWIVETFTNVAPAGRKGLHNYNSQDHAMMSATLAVRNFLEGTAFDVWSVNTESEYAEEGDSDPAIEERLVPRAREA